MRTCLSTSRLPALATLVSASLAAQVTLSHPDLGHVSYGQPVTFSAALATAGAQPDWVWSLDGGDPDGSLTPTATGQALFDPPFVLSPQSFTLRVRAVQHPDQEAKVTFVVQPHQALASVFPKVMGHKVDGPRLEFLAGHETEAKIVNGPGAQARFPRISDMVSLAGHPDAALAECWAVVSDRRVALVTPEGQVSPWFTAGEMVRACGDKGSPILWRPAVRHQGGAWQLALFQQQSSRLFLMDAKGGFTTRFFGAFPIRGAVYGKDGTLFVAAGKGDEIFRLVDDKREPFATLENPFQQAGWSPEVTGLALDPSTGDLLAGVRWTGNQSGEAVYSLQRVTPEGKASHCWDLPSGKVAGCRVACRGRDIFVLDGNTRNIGQLDRATGRLSFLAGGADQGPFTPGPLPAGAGAAGAGMAAICPTGMATGPDGRFRVWTDTCIGDLILPQEPVQGEKGEPKADSAGESKGDTKAQTASGSTGAGAGKAPAPREEFKR